LIGPGPFALGYVLGPLAESYLFASVARYGGAWLLRLGVVILFFVAVMVAFYPYFREIMLRKRGVVMRYGGKRLMSLVCWS